MVLPWLMGMCVEVGGLYLAMVLDGVSLAGAAGIAVGGGTEVYAGVLSKGCFFVIIAFTGGHL